MAYDIYTAERIKRILLELTNHVEERKMMGGLCFMVNEKMACGVFYDKTLACDMLMLRLGETLAAEALAHPHALAMDFTGRVMKNFVVVKPEGYDSDDDLTYWIQKCLDYNPFAKKSKKRKPKS